MPYSPPADPSAPGIYVWPLSVLPGEQVEIHARGPVGASVVDVVRDGDRPALLDTIDVRLAPHELAPDADARGCDWPVVAQWRHWRAVWRQH